MNLVSTSTAPDTARPDVEALSSMSGHRQQAALTCAHAGGGSTLLTTRTANNRWHLDCFRCNQCHTLLDSDANLLLLGDGSLICNNCTYSCSACGNKIEDLAILTGDQAFCATCFRCRNCKRKIENLRYARTSQGIFCMSCHESLMARRRKKSKAAAAQAKAKEKEMLVDKSLPALPPNAVPQGAFAADRSAADAADTDIPTELSPRPRPQYPQNDSSRSSSRRAQSPERSTGETGHKDGLILPTMTYRNNRHSAISQASDVIGPDGDGFFIPLALEPSPAPTLTPRSTSNTPRSDPNKNKDTTASGKDYFSPSRSAGRSQMKDTPNSQASTPHIAFQEKGRTASSEHVETAKDSSRRPSPYPTGSSASGTASPAIGSDEPRRHLANPLNNWNANDKSHSTPDKFRLQDVPKRKRSNDSRSSSKTDIASENNISQSRLGTAAPQPPRRDISSNLARSERSDSSPQRFGQDQSYLSTEKATTPISSQESRLREDSESSPSTDSATSSTPPTREIPTRNDTQGSSKSIPRKERVGVTIHKTTVSSSGPDPMSSSASSAEGPATTPAVNGKSISRPVLDETSQSHRTLTRPAPPQQKFSETYMAPRAPPAPPPVVNHKAGKAYASSVTGEPVSPKLPRWSAGGDFTMDEDMARILGTDEGSQSILRRVSNAVRHGRTGSEASVTGRHGHGRSISETTNRAIASPHWPKTPIVEDEGGHTRQISSPISISSPRADDPALLRRQLRNSEQRVAELERQFTTSSDLKSMNKQLVEKRKTVSELDSQAELMIRQIEVLAGYVEKAKGSKAPLDLQEMEESAIKEFVLKLERLKQAMSREVETLFEERETLLEEKDQAMKARDRALVEFEQLSSKNAQLADLNNDLTTQIQGRFKAQSAANVESPKPANGLNIYTNHSKEKGSMHLLEDATSLNSGTTAYGSSLATVSTYPHMMDQDAAMEPAAVLSAPHVVNIRKGQAKKFNWKKGGATVAKGVSKGFKGAFSSERNEKSQWQGQPGDNIGMPYNTTVTAIDSPSHMPSTLPRSTSSDPRGFGLFKKSHTMPKAQSSGNLSTVVAESPATLFGSELVDRAEYERRHIPSVVIRCIEEVELRGMEVEGIYRKTGGSGLVKIIQEGFEKSEDYDISDPDLDITAVTSVLKQYFRKLPTPLLTFDIYDRVLESLSRFSAMSSWGSANYLQQSKTNKNAAYICARRLTPCHRFTATSWNSWSSISHAWSRRCRRI